MKKNKRTTFMLEEEHTNQLIDLEQEIKKFTNLKTKSSFIRFMLEKINSGDYEFLSPKEDEKELTTHLVDIDLFNETKKQAKKQNYTTAKELIIDVLEYEHERLEDGEIPFSPKD